MIKHVESIRLIPGLENATVVFVLESNLAFESQHILHALNEARVKKWLALSEGASGGVGWLTTHERKESMCFREKRAALNLLPFLDFASASALRLRRIARISQHWEHWSVEAFRQRERW